MAANVLIVQRRLTHYRVPLFESMRALLAEQDVNLRLAYGQPTSAESTKKDSGEIDWAISAPNRYVPLGSNYLCYQHLPREHVRNADMVIVTQENRLLANYLLSVRRQLSDLKLALWGHGANLQGPAKHSLRESFKRWFSCKVDWWFAYTELSRSIVVANGFPPERITCLNNAIDTRAFLEMRRRLQPMHIESQRRKLGMDGAPVGVYLGSLHAEKRIDFLQEAADAVHARLPTFKFVVIGDGPQRASFAAWAAARDWVRYLGRVSDEEKVHCLAAGDIILNPGLVGLVILDSFCGEVPLITTDCGIVSPEIAYLDHGVNGIITKNSLDDFSAAAVALLTRPDRLQALRAGCRASAARYSIANMASNFSAGIVQALGSFASKPGTLKCG